jgi:hypothetical protein
MLDQRLIDAAAARQRQRTPTLWEARQLERADQPQPVADIPITDLVRSAIAAAVEAGRAKGQKEAISLTISAYRAVERAMQRNRS